MPTFAPRLRNTPTSTWVALFPTSSVRIHLDRSTIESDGDGLVLIRSHLKAAFAEVDRAGAGSINAQRSTEPSL